MAEGSETLTSKKGAAVALVSAERELLAALRRGEESAFVELLDRYGASMLRVATLYVSSRAVAEEVVQECWVAVLRGLDRFEGRSSLRTWIFAILANCAKKRAQLEGRSLPFASLDSGADEPSVEPDRFFRADHSRWPRCWTTLVDDWEGIPDERLLSQEALGAIRAAIDRLPPGPRAVMTLRDVEGWSAEEVCAFLGITENNQRVLLHRGRTGVRRRLERYFEEAEARC